jgi:hypothetical protein
MRTTFRLRGFSLLIGLISLACLAPGPIPAPWVDGDVGGPATAGSATFDPANSTWVLHGGGGDIWGTSDQFNYAYMPLNGDGTITAHVVGITDSAGGATMDQWAKAGAMIRESTGGGSTYAFECFTGANGTDYQFRTTTGAGAGNSGQTGGGAAHHWVQVKRVGTTFTGSWSDDGVTWTLHGTQTITMAANVLIGLANCAHNNSTTSIGTFDNVSVLDGAGNYLWPEAPPTGLTATAGVNRAMLSWTAPAGATSYDVLRGTTSGGPYSPVQSGITTTSYTDLGASFPGTYYYVVEAVGPLGTSPYSNEASCTPLQPHISVSPPTVTVVEAGGTTTFTVSLLQAVQAGQAVTVPITVDAAGGTTPYPVLVSGFGQAAPVNTFNLVFGTGGSPNLSENVTVTGQDDNVAANPRNFTIHVGPTAAGGDPFYSSINYIPDVTGTQMESDRAGFVVNPTSGLVAVDGGPSVSFTVQATSIPQTTAVLNVVLSDTRVASVSPPQLTFNSSNWSTPHLVTVTPLDDMGKNPAVFFSVTQLFVTLSVDPNLTNDAQYQALPAISEPIAFQDNYPVPGLPKVWGCGLMGAEAGLLLGLFRLLGRRRREA